MRSPLAGYYCISDRLLAGPHPGSGTDEEVRDRISRLLEAGVTTFVDLTAPGEAPAFGRQEYRFVLPAHVRYHQFPTADLTCPSDACIAHVIHIVESVVGRAYVHCMGGCGRTGTIAGCYLVQAGWSPEAALAEVRELTMAAFGRICPETQEQRDRILGCHNR